MSEEGKTLNPAMYIIPDLLEQIFLRLPLKPILRFKTVSKQWKTILESKNFAEMRKKFQNNHRKILIAGDHHHRTDPPFEDIEIVSLHCDDATRPSMTCDGLVCIPVPGSVNVLNPSTGESLTFPSGPLPVTCSYYSQQYYTACWWNIYPGYYAMGFGKDRVNGSYKVVRMFYNTSLHCEILDVEIGEWKEISNPPPYIVDARRRSACVNGSIYWLEIDYRISVLALDLHTEEFRDILTPPMCMAGDQVVNLDDRLAIATKDMRYDWILKIWCLDGREESWSKIYTISLSYLITPETWEVWFRPITVSKRGNLFFFDSRKRLYKYKPKTDEVCCLSQDICVISPIVENLIRLSSSPKTFGYRSGLEQAPSSRIPKIFRHIKFGIPNMLLTTTLVSLVIFRCFAVSSKS